MLFIAVSLGRQFSQDTLYRHCVRLDWRDNITTLQMIVRHSVGSVHWQGVATMHHRQYTSWHSRSCHRNVPAHGTAAQTRLPVSAHWTIDTHHNSTDSHSHAPFLFTGPFFCSYSKWWHGVVVNVLVVINQVTLHRAQLVLGRVTVCGW